MTHTQPAAKYIIKAKFVINGVVERHDIIGAIFGQTEGLFGPELDLRELQKSGRIGRINVKLKTSHNKTTGVITIPSGLDRASTAIIAATLESISRVGPYSVEVTLDRIEDLREEKRREIIERAKQILREWTVRRMPSTSEVLKEVYEALAPVKVVKYGPEGLPAGPDVEESDEVIIVEGRADVINLLRYGITNVVALEGVKVPESIIKLCEKKEATAFLDGDHAGDLILKELLQVAKVKYVARAPKGMEVEDLSHDEVVEALKRRVPVEELLRAKAPVKVPKKIADAVDELTGSLEAILYDEDFEEIERVPVSELAQRLKEVEGVHALVFDGVITQRILDIASERGIKMVVADRVSDVVKRPLDIQVLTFADVRGAIIEE
ncbi:MAG TPA: DNA primase [Candidatus Bathyarchaeota archaeon]|nr:DNA primase [Candidatus Bathyarchaeota archaeon]